MSFAVSCVSAMTVLVIYFNQRKATEIATMTFAESMDRQGCKKLAVNAILESKYEKHLSEIYPYIDRETLESNIKMQLTKKLIEADKPDAGNKQDKRPGYIPSILICGPRGCGKSVVMANILKDRAAVVPITYDGSTDKEFAEAVFRSLSINLPSSTDPKSFLIQVLEMLRKEKTNKPIFLVEVDKRFGSSNLESLLLFLKTLGDDCKLVLPIVILSSSHSALGLKIEPGALRSRFIDITDLTHDESRKFFSELLKKLELPEHTEKDVIEWGIENIGNRLVHLHAVASQLPTEFTLKEFKSVVTQIHEQNMDSCELAFNEFSNEFPLINQDKVLKQLERGLKLKELCEELKCTSSKLLTVNGSIEPHVFYVCPSDFTVRLGSKFMEKHVMNLTKSRR